MARLLASLALLSGSLGGCFFLPSSPRVKVSFAPTGATRPPLPGHTPVRLYLMKPPSAVFEELGLIEVEDGTLQERVNAARAEARRRGGNAIVLQGSRSEPYSYTTSTEVQVDEDCTGVSCKTTKVPVSRVGSTHVQTFVVILERLGRPRLGAVPGP